MRSVANGKRRGLAECAAERGRLCGTDERAQHERWVNREKARYYRAHLLRDLFGDWTLLTVWGGCGSSRGRLASTEVGSYAEGLDELGEIGERRFARV